MTGRVLIVDEEVQGVKEKFSDVDDLKEKVIECLDDTVETVTIKKRVISDNSLIDGTKYVSSGNHNRT